MLWEAMGHRHRHSLGTSCVPRALSAPHDPWALSAYGLGGGHGQGGRVPPISAPRLSRSVDTDEPLPTEAGFRWCCAGLYPRAKTGRGPPHSTSVPLVRASWCYAAGPAPRMQPGAPAWGLHLPCRVHPRAVGCTCHQVGPVTAAWLLNWPPGRPSLTMCYQLLCAHQVSGRYGLQEGLAPEERQGREGAQGLRPATPP